MLRHLFEDLSHLTHECIREKCPEARPFGRCVLGVLVCIAATVNPVISGAQTFVECQQTTGMGAVSAHSNASVSGSVNWLSGGPGGNFVLCDPPYSGQAQVNAGGSMARVAYVAGVGAHFSTTALSDPNSSGDSRAAGTIGFAFPFRVVPDDPSSTTPVEIEIVTRHRSGSDQQSSGSSTAANSLQGQYAVNVGATAPFHAFFAQWDTAGQPPIPDGYFDVFRTITVPVNVDHVFQAWLQPQSYARANTPPTPGSASAALSLGWTFTATTAAPATIVFAYEDLLDLPPPELDSVPEPGLASCLPPLLLFLGGLASARQSRQRL